MSEHNVKRYVLGAAGGLVMAEKDTVLGSIGRIFAVAHGGEAYSVSKATIRRPTADDKVPGEEPKGLVWWVIEATSKAA